MKKIEHLIKSNLVIQKIYCFVFSLLFRTIGIFVRVDKKLILFNSFSGKSFNDSPKILYESIISSDGLKDYKCVWSFNDPDKFKDIVKCKIVKQDSFKYFMTVLKAGYWITNVNIERGLKLKRKKNFYLNTWHGTGPKTSGNLVKHRKDYNFKNINALLSNCEYLENLFVTGFNADREHIYRFGRPREDYLYNSFDCQKAERNRLLLKYNLPSNKKYVLFAPTWRESKDGGKTFSLLDCFDLRNWVDGLGKDYIVLFRAHSITNSYNIPNDDSVIDATGFEDINELYMIADILITDYSSCFSDYSILEKPMICYAPDYDEYVKERGILFDLNKYFSNGVIKEEKDLFSAIKSIDYEKECELSRAFKKEFASSNGNSTEKTLQLLFPEVFSK